MIGSYEIDWSAWIAVFALIFSVVTFLVHDKKIKQQEKLLNDYQLGKIEEEKENKQKAQVKANYIKGRGGNNILKVFNAGQSKAENVNFFLNPEDQDVFILNSDIFPLEFLNPQESMEINLTTHKGSPNKLKIALTWDDEFKLNNQYKIGRAHV